MSRNIWQKLKQPIIALAPMAEVTDSAFRQVIAKASRRQQTGQPGLFFTEFVSADGLASIKGRRKLKAELSFSPKEKPIIVQLFGARPENFKIAASIVKQMGFAGVDINMGCPDRKVEKQGAGAALIKNPQLARDIIEATKVGADPLPVSVKTRIGYQTEDIGNWGKFLVACNPTAITFHLRTRKELSKVPAHWELANKLKPLALGTQVLILANGDIQSTKEAREKCRRYKLDGVMIGRGVYGRPWLFAGQTKASVKRQLETLIFHAKTFDRLYNRTKNFAIMRKHFKAYASGFDGASLLRAKLMTAQNSSQVEKIIKDFLNS